MKIAGLVKTSLIDYPGKIAAVIFTQGCNFRCPFCHNPELILASQRNTGDNLGPALAYLRKRSGQLDGVVITGGEPTLHQELPAFLEIIKGYGYSIKLDTNGSLPAVLEQLIRNRLVHYIAMDIKAPWPRTQAATGSSMDASPLRQSVDLILSSGLPHEFRTTTLKPLHSREDLLGIGRSVAGADRYILQRFRNEHILDPDFSKSAEPFSDAELESICKELQSEGVACSVR